MYKSKSLAKNAMFNIAKTFCSIAFPVITFTYAAHILGVEGVGRVNFAKSFITYFTMLAQLGMNYYGTREAAKRHEKREQLSKYVHEMLFINGITTALAYVLLFLGLALVPKLQSYRTLLMINSVAIILQGMGMEWLYQALEEYRYIAIRSICFQVGAIAALFLFVRDTEDVVPYCAVMLLASSGSYILNFINARRIINWQWYGHYKIKEHIRPLLWLFAMAVSIELYTILDSTMLGFFQNDVAVGRYTAAVKVNKLIITLITAIGVVLIPQLSFYFDQGDKKKVEILVNRAYNCVFMLSIPAAVGLFVLSDEIILLFSGHEFTSAGLTMRILTPIVLLIPFSVTTNQQTFIPMGKEKLILLSTSVGALTNLICNALMIPLFAENGAAVATVLAETMVAVICLVNVKRHFDIRNIFKQYYQYWMGALPIPMIAAYVKTWAVHYAIQILIIAVWSSACYFMVLFLTKNECFRKAFARLLELLSTRKGLAKK